MAAVTGQASAGESTSVLTRVGQTQRIRALAGAHARRPTSQVSPLANIKSAAKKARQAEKHRQRNVALRTRMRSAIKKAVKATGAGDAAAATTACQAAVPAIDTMVSKGLVHRNKAARHKSRLNKALKTLKASKAG